MEKDIELAPLNRNKKRSLKGNDHILSFKNECPDISCLRFYFGNGSIGFFRPKEVKYISNIY
jgi:hypothetical protein